jgi:hypothetical protein
LETILRTHSSTTPLPNQIIQLKPLNYFAKMRLSLLTALLATLLPTHAASPQTPVEPILQSENTIDIFAWPLNSASPQTIAQITYDHQNAIVKKYTAPLIPTGESIVRIGFYPDGSASAWSGIATAASNLAPEVGKKLKLHLTSAGKVYNLGFEAVSSEAGAAKEGLVVEVVPIGKGEAPILNKPVVVAEDGQVEGKEPEKTFLQK